MSSYRPIMLVFVASHVTLSHGVLQGSVPGTQLGKLDFQSFATWMSASPAQSPPKILSVLFEFNLQVDFTSSS